MPTAFIVFAKGVSVLENFGFQGTLKSEFSNSAFWLPTFLRNALVGEGGTERRSVKWAGEKFKSHNHSDVPEYLALFLPALSKPCPNSQQPLVPRGLPLWRPQGLLWMWPLASEEELVPDAASEPQGSPGVFCPLWVPPPRPRQVPGGFLGGDSAQDRRQQ